VVARIGEAYGDGDFRLLKLFRAIKRRRFAIIGTGSNLHQPIHIRDLCECLFALCKLPAGSGQIFNVAGADIVSTRDMANAVAAALSQPASFPRLPMWPMTTLATTAEFVCKPLGVAPPLSNRSLDFFRRTLLLDCSRLELATGASATTRFTQGAATTATWYRANGLL
jgi:nucleoside-diphosphate-sugar epimerase